MSNSIVFVTGVKIKRSYLRNILDSTNFVHYLLGLQNAAGIQLLRSLRGLAKVTHVCLV